MARTGVLGRTGGGDQFPAQVSVLTICKVRSAPDTQIDEGLTPSLRGVDRLPVEGSVRTKGRGVGAHGWVGQCHRSGVSPHFLYTAQKDEGLTPLARLTPSSGD